MSSLTLGKSANILAIVAVSLTALAGAAYVALPFALPSILEWLHPDITFQIRDGSRSLYLTIDDAPSTETSAILAVLQKHHAKATFFVIGSWVHSDDQLRQIVAAGCPVGHHMWNTRRCSSLPLEQFKAEYDATDRLLRRFSSAPDFRPPSDFGTHDQLAYVRSQGRQPVLGTVFAVDSSLHSPVILAWLMKWLAVPGGILIMHDGPRRGKVTATVLDAVLPYFQAHGYEFRLLHPETTNQPSTPGTR